MSARSLGPAQIGGIVGWFCFFPSSTNEAWRGLIWLKEGEAKAPTRKSYNGKFPILITVLKRITRGHETHCWWLSEYFFWVLGLNSYHHHFVWVETNSPRNMLVPSESESGTRQMRATKMCNGRSLWGHFFTARFFFSRELSSNAKDPRGELVRRDHVCSLSLFLILRAVGCQFQVVLKALRIKGCHEWAIDQKKHLRNWAQSTTDRPEEWDSVTWSRLLRDVKPESLWASWVMSPNPSGPVRQLISPSEVQDDELGRRRRAAGAARWAIRMPSSLTKWGFQQKNGRHRDFLMEQNWGRN